MGSLGPTPSPSATKSRLKTMDWGSNGVMISLDQQGTILHLGFYHPKHGVILVSPFEQFDGNRFYEPSYVRSYRAKMMEWIKDSTPGYGLRIHGHPAHAPRVSKDRNHVTLTYQTKCGIDVQTIVTITKRHQLQQTTILSTTSVAGVAVPVTMNLGMSLNRASYGQLTEGGPVPLPESVNVFQMTAVGNTFCLQNPNLDTHIEGQFWTNRSDVDALAFEDMERTFHHQPVQAERSATLAILPDLPAIFNFTVQIPSYAGLGLLEKETPLLFHPEPQLWRLQNPEALTIIRGNLEYILGNCMIPISQNSTCVITDHVALPLGWNRDNYWQIRFLLDAFQKLDSIVDPATANLYKEKIRSNVRAHLHWVFRDAQRPHRFWHRSYIANGVPKDGPIFQLDQQCYPIIELCDFLDCIPNSKLFVRGVLGETTISDIIDVLLARRNPTSKLYPTDETPGDDPVEYPYHFSSHVLVWYTFTRLAKLLDILGDTANLQASRVKALAKETYSSTIDHFVAYNAATQETMFAYLTDGSGKHAFYHDANDIPTLFAGEWGFAESEELVSLWMRTIKFGLSIANNGGYYGDGPFGGLGSVHTRGPWPLGYFQELVFAEIVGDASARENAWNRIKGAMFFDGLFSEAVDNSTGECTSKAWFSWPGSMIGGALLRDRSGWVMSSN